MAGGLDRLVRQRAGERCEYCHLPQSVSELTHPLDHIVARQHGGPSTPDNLALSCLRCNAHKGPNIAGIDPKNGQVVPLFHPRRDSWADHFEWLGATLIGRTPVGRVTIQVLAMNDPDALALREALIEANLFSP
jgi:hypothetical protein